MAKYPLISGNAQSQFDLSTLTDNDFDVFISSDSNNIQTAFLVFVLKNAATDVGENLIINSISGNAAFNAHFTLDFKEDGQSLLHMGPDGQANNVVKAPTVSGLSETATGVTNAQLVATANLASGIAGNYGLFVSTLGDLAWDSAFNVSGNSKLSTFYTTNDIINNAIPPNSYATFIARYKPTATFSEVDLLDSPMKLTIGNSHNEKVITFNGVSANDLIFAAVKGTATDNAGATDTFTATTGVINDEGVFNLGYHPIGYDWGADSKTLKFTDISTTVGEYTFEPPGTATKVFFPYISTASINSTLDGYDLSGNEIGFYTLKNRLNASYKHFQGSITEVGLCGSLQTGQGENVQITALPVAPDVYKNFELRSDADAPELINIRSSHTDWINDSSAADYEHVTAADITLKTHYFFKHVRNIISPQLTAPGTDNETFVFSVQTGFYNKLTMSETEKTIHYNNKKSLNEIHWDANSFNTFLTLNQSTEGPYIAGTTGTLFRDKKTTLGVYFRYNNFDNNTDDEYKINTTGINLNASNDNSIALYHDYTNNGANWYPKTYDLGVDFTEGGSIWGSAISTPVSDTALQVFSADAVNANELALKYEIAISKFVKGNLYPTGQGSAPYANILHQAGNEEAYGIFSTLIQPAYSSNENTIWAKGLGFHNVQHIRYRMNFHPKQSRLELVDMEEANASNFVTSNVDFDVEINGQQYSTSVIKEPVAAFYLEGGTIAITENVQSKLYTSGIGILGEEGDWYGAAGMSINKPYVWSNLVIRRYNDIATGYKIAHNPTNNLIKHSVTSGDYIKESSEGAPFLFRLEDAVFDTTTSTYKAKGYIGIQNTGDYACYIQTVSIGHKNLKMSHGSYFSDNYMNNNRMLFPAGDTAGTGDTRKPHASSAEPSWTAAFVSVSNPDFGDLITTYDALPTATVTVSGVPTPYSGFQHLVPASEFSGAVNNVAEIYDTYGSGASGNRNVVIPNQELSNSQNSHPFRNKIAVEFQLDPTNNAAHDQGRYYAQLMVSYFVNDYKNRYEPEVDASGNITENLATVGTTGTSLSTRLHVSKYLIKCEVSSDGILQVVDSEGDESGNTIQLPNMNIG